VATSNSTNYTRTARQIIKSALRLLGVIQSGEEPTAAEIQDGLEAFEIMVKTFQAQGYHLWTYAEATLFLTASTVSYSLTGARAVSSFVQTASSADASSTDLTIDVDSISGIADGDVLGIVTSSTAIHWTTVDGAPAGSTITFDDALTVDVSSGAVVYAYTAADDLTGRPLRVESVRRRDSGNIDTPLGEMAREEYFDLPNKTNTGVPVEFYYDPGRDTGTLYIWPAPTTITQTLKFTYLRALEDIDAITNNMDFPQEWLETLKYQLAVRLAPEYGVAVRPDIAGMAGVLLDTMMGWDTEPTSVMFQPDRGW